MKHEHSWKSFTDVPLSEPAGKYWQCTECKVIGHTKPTMLRSKQKRMPRVFVYRCYKQGCKESGVCRLPGRGARGSLRFACTEHGGESILEGTG